MPDKKKADTARTVSVRLADALKKRLHVYGINNDLSLQAVIVAACEEFLKRHGA